MTDNIIVIYDKLETDFSHFGLAVIRKTIDLGPRIFQRRNADYTVDFSVPYTDEAVPYLAEENIVKVSGQLFIIRTVKESRDTGGKLLATVFAEHICTELLTEYIPLLQYTNATAAAILDGILAGTRFTGNALAVPTSHDFTVERNSVVWGLNHLIALSKTEMQRDNFNITFKPQIGADNGVRISYRKNLRSITRTKESRGVITRLFVFGKDGITLTQPIDSPNIGLYPRPKCGEVTFDEVEDLQELRKKGEAYLATVDTHLLSYVADVTELKGVKGYGESESFAIGDTVHVDDEDLKIEVTARIVEYEEYPDAPERSRVVLANFLPDLMDTLNKMQNATNTIERITTGGGRVNTNWIDGKINTLKNQLVASGAYASAEVRPNEGFLLENTDSNSPDYGALYLGPGIFAIASEKVGGNWNWRTFGKGSGFTADVINAGILNASLIRINSSTTFEPGYDPTTKETPESAQAKADAAQAAAEAVALAKSQLAQSEAEAYADGIVTAEEQARMNQARETLEAAQRDATEKSNAAKLAAITTAEADAKAKANAAQAAAEAEALAQAQLVKEQVEAYADGIVTAEEQARINQATENLSKAKTDATTKANAAEEAAKKASVLKGVKYKSVYTDENGFHIDGPDGEVMRMGEFAPGQFGTIAFHKDGSTTALTPDGLIRKTASGDKPYNYLVAAGSDSTGANNAYFVNAEGSANGESISNITITLPSDFKGKDFKVILALKRDSFFAQELKQTPLASLRVLNYAPVTTQLEVVSVDKVNGKFTVKGFGSLYRWNVIYGISGSTVIPNYTNVTRYDYALDFSWIALV